MAPFKPGDWVRVSPHDLHCPNWMYQLEETPLEVVDEYILPAILTNLHWSRHYLCRYVPGKEGDVPLHTTDFDAIAETGKFKIIEGVVVIEERNLLPWV